MKAGKQIQISVLTIVLLLFLSCLHCWAVPGLISYQGKLTDLDGTPVDNGTYTIQFRVYDVASGGTDLWEETQDVAVIDGIYNVILPSNPDYNSFDLTLLNNTELYLGISVEADSEMVPRQRITSTFYALKAGDAETMQGMGSEEFIHTNQKAGGDLSGTYPSPMVTRLRGRPISLVLPFSEQVLKYNGSDWAPAKDENSGGGHY